MAVSAGICREKLFGLRYLLYSTQEFASFAYEAGNGSVLFPERFLRNHWTPQTGAVLPDGAEL